MIEEVLLYDPTPKITRLSEIAQSVQDDIVELVRQQGIPTASVAATGNLRLVGASLPTALNPTAAGILTAGQILQFVTPLSAFLAGVRVTGAGTTDQRSLHMAAVGTDGLWSRLQLTRSEPGGAGHSAQLSFDTSTAGDTGLFATLLGSDKTSSYLRSASWLGTNGVAAEIAAAVNNFTFNTDVGEKTLLTYTVPAGLLGTNRGILFVIGGDFLFNSGAPTLTLKVKYGATTLWGTASAAITLSATRRSFVMFGLLENKGATNSQELTGWAELGDAAAGSVAGVGAFGAPMFRGAFAGTAAEDSTTAKTFSVTGTMSVSNVANEMRGVAVAMAV